MEQVENFFKRKIKLAKINETTHAVIFPMYKLDTEMQYEINLISDKGRFYLSDQGFTYKELDEIFEMNEPDVKKNIIGILKHFGCFKEKGSNAFFIECTPQDIDIKLSYLIQAMSLMQNMKIFYE